MASQQARPPWFRLSAIANRPPAPNLAPTPTPAPAPAPIRPLAPIPTALRPPIPIGLPSAVTQTQEAPPPPAVGSPTPAAPLPSPPKSPISTPAPPSVSAESPLAPSGPAAPPLRSPSPAPATDSRPSSSPDAAAARNSPAKQPTTAGVPPPQFADPAKSPVMRPTPPPPRTLSSPIPSPPPSTIGLKPTSPVQLKPSETSAYGPASSSPTPASPKTKTKTKSPASSEKTSPVPRPGASTAALGATANHKVAAPVSSPKRSPGIKPFSNPPSPFTLPPVQMTEDEDEQKIPAEVDQKTVLVQETIEKPIKKTSALNNGIDSVKREHVVKDRSTNRKKSDSDEFGMSVITLAGENKGAIMELSPSQKKTYSNGNPQSFLKNKSKILGDQLSSDGSEEGNSNRNGTTNNKAMKLQAQPMTVYLNSNVQGVNNSILSNCNYNYNDPGVHLSLDKKVNGSRHKNHHG